MSLLVEPLPVVAVKTFPICIGLPKFGPFSTYVEAPPVVFMLIKNDFSYARRLPI